MSPPVDVKGVCRACLLDSSDKLRVLADEEVDMYASCTSVQLSECNSLPKTICTACLELLNKFNSFKQQCISSNQTLIQNIKSGSIKEEIVPIDSKVKVEDDYEDDDAFDHFDGSVKYESSDSDTSPDFIIGYKKKKPQKTNAVKRIRKPEPSYLKKYQCQICKSSFVYEERLEIHKLTHQGIKEEFVCQSCGAQYKSRGALINHVKNKHTPYDKNEKLSCSICGKAMNSPLHLKEHEKRHTRKPVKKHICHVCGKSILHKNALMSHMQIHDLNRKRDIACPLCGKLFLSLNALASHKRRHGEKRIACTVCDFKFYNITALKRHMNVHSTVKPFKCNICQKRYSTSSFLKEHGMMHSGEKPFGCDTCSMCFISKRRLIEHTRTHTGEKPYKCEICNHAFTQRGTYKRHLKVHEKLEISNGNSSSIRMLNMLNRSERLKECVVSLIKSAS